MQHTTLWRAGVLTAIGALAATAGVALAGPASGTPFPEAFLYVKPAGSTNYTYFTGAVIQGVAPGSSTTFQVKIVNTGTIGDQFRFTLPGLAAQPFPDNGNPPAPEVLSVNGTVIPSETWITPFLAPGASQVVAVKVSVPRVLVGGSLYSIEMDYSPAEETGGYSSQNVAVSTAQSSGSSPADVFAKTGSQPFVGGWGTSMDPGSCCFPLETLAVQRMGSTGSATVRLQNDSPTAGRITLHASDLCFVDQTAGGAAWPMTIRDGFVNVTAAASAGTYTTPMLAPGAHHDLRLTIRNNSNPSCPAGGVFLFTSGQGQSMLTGVIATDAV